MTYCNWLTSRLCCILRFKPNAFIFVALYTQLSLLNVKEMQCYISGITGLVFICGYD